MPFDPKQAYVVSDLAGAAPLTCVCYGPKGTYVFGGSEDRTITRWEIGTDKKAVFKGHNSWIGALTTTPDGETLISAGYDDTLIWWPALTATSEPLRKVKAHEGWIRALVISPDGKLLASGGNDRLVKLWNVADGTLVRELKGHEGDIYSLTFHPNGQALLSGDLLGQIQQWDVATGKAQRRFEAAPLHIYEGGQAVHYGGVRALSVSADGRTVAAGGLHKATNPLGNVQEPLALRFQWEDAKLARSHVGEGLTNHTLWGLRFHPEGALIGCIGGGSAHLLFWGTEADKPAHKLDLPDTARAMALHPNGLQIATAHHDGKVRLVSLTPKPA